MEKGNQIPITFEAECPVQNMAWTEIQTSTEILKPGDVLYHSSAHLISEFFPKTTCFHDTYRSKRGHIYRLTVKNDVEATVYHNEYRIDLHTHKNDVEIHYIGTGTCIPIRDEHGRVVRYTHVHDILD